MSWSPLTGRSVHGSGCENHYFIYGLLTSVGAHCRGQQEPPSKTSLPAYDPACYLCPRNTRAQGDQNPDYSKVFIFVNDYSAVKEEQPAYESESKDSMSMAC